jgi:hypothetical protein
MASHQLQLAIDAGRQARLAATRVRNSLFPHWRQRAFRRHLGRFILGLQAIPQAEAARLTPTDLRDLNALISSVVAEAEAFMSEHHDATTKEVEQDRFVVTEIYQLRAIAETLGRHVTANPELMDVGWTMRTESGNRPKS